VVVEQEALTGIVIGCAIKVHRGLGPGFLESVYRNALVHELSKAGLAVQCEKRIQVRYDGALVGDFFADMVIQNTLLIENKAVQSLYKVHEAQLINYLVATQIDVGLLFNFGAQSLQFRRKSRVYRRREE
jgi:GxxExxY protein